MVNKNRITDKDYTWQELNCFYRPFAYSLCSTEYGEKRANLILLLASFYMTHCKADNTKMLYNRYHPFLIYLENEVSEKIQLWIRDIEVKNTRDIHKKIENCIERGNLVVAPFDLAELPYSGNYLKRHHRHYVCVKEYDADRRICHIHDNMHIKGGNTTRYEDFVMEYRILENGITGFHKYYDAGISRKACIWEIESSGDLNSTVQAFKDYFSDVMEKMSEDRLRFYSVEKEIAEQNIHTDFLDMVELMNFRIVFYSELIKFMELNYDDTGFVSEYTNKCKVLAEKWNLIKYMLMREQKNVSDNIDEAIAMEKVLLKEAARYLKSHEILKDTTKAASDDILWNPMNVNVEHAENKYRIRIPEHIVCDTWAEKDDAVQVLYSEPKSICVRIRNMKSDVGMAFHMGIIIKGANGEKILFGNSRNLHLAVFRADVASYELYQEDYAFEKDMTFKAVRGEKTISLYISDDGWEKVYEAEQDFLPVTMGAFIKTWEQCDMDVEIEADAEYYT